MKRFILALSLSACFLFSPTAHAQDKPKPAETEKKPEDRKANEELRMQVVFTESDGEKKISSLPYTLVLHTNGNEASLRVGLRVPVSISSSQYQYMDVGTNLDGNAWRVDDGRFLLVFSVEKSSLYWPPSDPKGAPSNESEPSGVKQPVVQKFQAKLNVLIRDGQTIQSMVATDPISGHVLKVDVTLNVMK